MLELPEVLSVADQLNNTVVGKRVRRILPPTKEHKFCWFNGDPAGYDAAVRGQTVVCSEGFGIFVELTFSNGFKLCFNDGVNPRFVPVAVIPAAYQLAVEFDDGSALVFTVAMYGGIILHDGGYDNDYYLKSKRAVTVSDPGFDIYFRRLFSESKPSLSLKAFLATEQRFPGIGNGVLQDILFAARLNPKRKLGTLGSEDADRLLDCMRSVLAEMTELGGRDTEKDIFGNSGGYLTGLSKASYGAGCPVCG